MVKKSKISVRERIVGCIKGKAIGGTLGTPVEGAMALLNLTYYDPVPNGILPNDDFDLQLLFLEAVEGAGGIVDASILARAWRDRMEFPFDEYGVATLNLKRGLKPPVTGWFDNPFKNCMGSPIRSEIWALLAPSRPKLAAYFALQDSIIDHAEESIAGEMFFAALESLAFNGETDFEKLILEALAAIDCNCQTAQAIRFTLENFRRMSWTDLRVEVLKHFGHPNFTEAPQNIAFTIFGLLYYRDDFEKALLCTVNCGYDTDCTAATLGAIWGLVKGDAFPQHWLQPIGERILASHGVHDMAVPATIDTLADHVIRVRKLVEDRYAAVTEKDAAKMISAQLKDLSLFRPSVDSELTISGSPVIHNNVSLKINGNAVKAHVRFPFKATISKNVLKMGISKSEMTPKGVRVLLEEASGRLHEIAFVTPHQLWMSESDSEESLLRLAYWPGHDKAFKPLVLTDRTFYLDKVAKQKWLLLRGFFHVAAFDKYRLGTVSECPARAWMNGTLIQNTPAFPCIPAPHRGSNSKGWADMELRAGWHRWDMLFNPSEQIREGKVCLVVAHAYTKQLIDYRLRREATGVYKY